MSQLTRIRKDFLSVLDFDPADFDRCLDLAAQLKADRPLGREAPSADALAGRHVASPSPTSPAISSDGSTR
jgi:ornithine carbamoyltransferase